MAVLTVHGIEGMRWGELLDLEGLYRALGFKFSDKQSNPSGFNKGNHPLTDIDKERYHLTL